MRVDLFLLGAVAIRVRACDGQALFSLFEQTGISPKALKRVKKTGDIAFFLLPKAYARFTSAAREAELDFGEQKSGFPTLLGRFLRTPGLVAGVLLSLLLFLGARAVLWDVRITGNEQLSALELETLLAECGLTEGAFLPALDADEIALALRRADERVAYAAVNLRGTVAYVQIREAEQAPEKTVVNPANLVAKYDGVVTMPLIFEGECLVAPGEVVRAGQILASGLSDTQNHGYLVTRAAGQVMARTVHTYEVRVPLFYEEKVYTGRKRYEISLFFFGRAQKVFKNTGKSTIECDIIEKNKYFTLSTGEQLPFGYGVVTAAEYCTVTRTRSGAEARALALAELEKQLAADGAARTLLEKHVEYRADKDGITLLCTVVCEEDIARTAEFTLQP